MLSWFFSIFEMERSRSQAAEGDCIYTKTLDFLVVILLEKHTGEKLRKHKQSATSALSVEYFK
jgi:hypothetical protein